MSDLFLSMREDLGLSNKGLDRRLFAHALLRSPDLLIAMANKDPNVTLAALAASGNRNCASVIIRANPSNKHVNHE